jgi:hypothetical protein
VPDPDIEGAHLPAITARPGAQGTTLDDDARAEEDHDGQELTGVARI